MVIDNPRYREKPFLRLLECYVLWAIDELPLARAQTLREMTPTLRSTYHVEGDWQEIIAAVMELPENMPSLIRDLWVKNQQIARQAGATLTPQQFAEMFVDENLVS